MRPTLWNITFCYRWAWPVSSGSGLRLSDPASYDKQRFERAGIRHYDLDFNDRSIPSERLVERFFGICRTETTLAVHGLGRTGTMIALWMMRHADFTASEAIAWLRIVRPG